MANVPSLEDLIPGYVPRTKKKPAANAPAWRKPVRPISDGDEYELQMSMFSNYSTWKYLQERAAKGDVTITTQKGTNQEHIVGAGKVAVMPLDEREAKDDRPMLMAYIDELGRSNIVINDGKMRTRDLADKIDEELHYGKVFHDDQPKRMTPWQDVMGLLVEKQKHTAFGRKHFAMYQGKRL